MNCKSLIFATAFLTTCCSTNNSVDVTKTDNLNVANQTFASLENGLQNASTTITNGDANKINKKRHCQSECECWQFVAAYTSIYKRLQHASGTEKLNEKQLEPGQEAEVRVWDGFGLTLLQGVILKKGAENQAYYLQPYDPKFGLRQEVRRLDVPKSNWDGFWKKLDEQNIFNLPDASNFDLSFPEDGLYIVIEIRTTDGYRIYGYPITGNSEVTNIPELINARNIYQLMGQEFDLNFQETKARKQIAANKLK